MKKFCALRLFLSFFMNNRVNYVNYCPNHEKILRITIISFLFMNNYVNYVNFCSRKPFFLKRQLFLTQIILPYFVELSSTEFLTFVQLLMCRP